MMRLAVPALLVLLLSGQACDSRETGADAGQHAGGGPATPGAQVAHETGAGSQALVPALSGAPDGAEAAPRTVAELCGPPPRPADQTVKMTGLFHGFRVEGCAFPDCVAGSSSSRSDWLFRTGGDCVYVTGGAPPGVDPINPSFSGRRIDLHARVTKDTGGKLRLHYIEARLLDD